MDPVRTPVRQEARSGGRGTTRLLLAYLLASLLVASGLSFGLAGAANAAAAGAPRGVDVELGFNTGTTYNGATVVQTNQTATLTVNYSRDAAPGSSFTVQLPPDFPVQTPLNLGDAAADLTVNGPDASNTLTFTFSNPITRDAGVFQLTAKLTEVQNSQVKDFVWNLNGTPNTTRLVYLEAGDTTAPTTNSQAKTGSTPFGGAATVTGGVVSIPASVIGRPVTYTVTGFSKTAKDPYVITDQLAAHMGYQTAATQKITTWDADGLNQQITTTPVTLSPSGSVAAGQSFSHNVALPANSRVELTYTATIADEAGRLYWQGKLQEQYDRLNDDTGGWASVALTNTATVDGTTKTSGNASFGVNRPAMPKPTVGTGTFQKVVNAPTGVQIVEEPAANGDLATPIPARYTLSYNLALFDQQNKYFTLSKNVVLHDQLKAGMSFAPTLDADLTGQGLTKVATCPTDKSTLATNTYCVSGNDLWIGVGMNAANSGSYTINAVISNVSALDKYNPTNLPEGQGWRALNVGEMKWSTQGQDNQTTARWVYTELNYRGDGTDGHNDTNYFTKSADREIQVRPGEAAKVPYTITAKATTDYETATTTIVDYVDRDIFDIPTSLEQLKASTVVTYGNANVLPSDYTITEDSAGNLRFALTAAKAAAVPNKHAEFKVVVTLSTFPVDGKQAVEISNRADLEGADSTTLYWSEKTTEASSFGNVAEVRKTVRDSTQQTWTSNLRLDPATGKKILVYRVQFLARGNYGNNDGAKITSVTDVLPEGVVFKGFINGADADTTTGTSQTWQDLTGNVRADYDNGVITFTGTGPFNRNASVTAHFAVELAADVAPDTPIVNQIGGTSATVTKTDGYPIAIAKQSSADPSTVINDANARFVLKDDQGVPVVSDIFVENGMLKVAGTSGNSEGVKVTAPGVYYLSEINPPAGYVKSDAELKITVGADELPPRQTFMNQPIGGHVKVGDYVWVDKNHDGLQDATDLVVPNVELKIERIDATGTAHSVTGVNNMPVTNQVTSGQGKYLFDLLPVLAANETYRVTIVKTPTTLDGYVPTTTGPLQGNGTQDSSTGSANTVVDLTSAGTQDLSLDFGFVKPYVRVGDYVWIDVDRDGTQDGTSVAIEGVKLRLYGPGDVAVEYNVYGDPILDQVTDARGFYLFDNLPPLAAGQHYTVKIVQGDPDTVDALRGLIPTTEGSDGGAGSKDSSSWVAESTKNLSTHQAEDLTLDFGFIRQAVSVGDYVWIDTNRDGKQGDPTKEPGLGGVLLEVYGPDGVKVTKDVDGKDLPEVRTNAQGKYEFVNLPALPDVAGVRQSYTVKIVATDPQTSTVLDPYVVAPTDDDNGPGADDSSSWESASTADLSVDGTNDPTLDFGFMLKSVSVGDYVWIDHNRDGIQDHSSGTLEEPVAGVTMRLVLVEGGVEKSVTNVLGEPVDTYVTDQNGHYIFNHLPVLKAGLTYRVSIDQTNLPAKLANYVPTVAGAGNDEAQDSSTWSTETSLTTVKLVNDGEHDPTLDFGFVEKKVSVGNKVWIDANEDGVRDPNEDPIPGVTLTITRTDGEPVVDVYGDPVTETVTDNDGNYEFDDLPALPPGTHYTVTIDYPKSPILVDLNLVPTNPGNRGSDTDPANDYSHTDSAESSDLTEDGDHDPTLDFGFRNSKVSVGDYVWIDVNRDGLQDATDVPLKGVVLKLTDPDGNPVSDVFGQPVTPATTDAKGFYEFINLPVLPVGKSYTVTIDRSDVSTVAALEGLVVTTAGVGTDKGVDSSTESASSWADLSIDGAVDPTLDFGFQRAAVKVGDYVWLDSYPDGRQGKKERGIEGVVLKLTGPDGKPVRDVNGKPVTTVTTDANGFYEFTELPVLAAGESYTVSIVKKKSKKALKGLYPTIASQGNQNRDSDTGSAVSWRPLTSHGAEDMTLDFGFTNGEVAGDSEENPDGNGNGGVDADGTEPGEVAGASEENGALPQTGASVSAWTIALGLLLVVAGVGVLVRRRRVS